MGNSFFSILGTSVQPKDPAGRSQPQVFVLGGIIEISFCSPGTHRCNFDAKASKQDVEID
jgi:hypothetical protein